MDYLEINRNFCRICLNDKGVLNWNNDIYEFSGISYKNCYFKYTQLTQSNLDVYPTKLCEVCAEELKNAHLLFKKALESFDILQTALTVKDHKAECCEVEPYKSQPTKKRRNTIDEDRSTELSVNSPTNNNAYDNESLAETENAINNSKKMCMDVSATVEPSHFIDIHNFKSPAVLLLEENAIERCDTNLSELTSIKIIGDKRKKLQDSPVPLMEEQLRDNCCVALLKLSATKKISNKRKKLNTPLRNLEESLSVSCAKEPQKPVTKKLSTKKKRKSESLANISLDHQMSEKCDIELPKRSAAKKDGKNLKKREPAVDIVLENNIQCSDEKNSTLLSKIKPAVNPREKYLLLCAYCSLKVEGASKLKKHEATHSENRIRTETCPKCGLKLYTERSLKCHMKTHDANRQKNFKCEFCEKAFFNRGALNVHRRIHLGLMVACQICSKEYYRQVDLNKHLRIHSAAPLQKNVEKIKYAIQCQYCNKSVLTAKWKEHKAAHLNQPQVKCKICDKNFFSRSSCAKHLRKVHHKTRSEYNEFIHYFDDCNNRMTNLFMKQQETIQLLVE